MTKCKEPTNCDDEITLQMGPELGYKEMGEDQERETEAMEWAEATIGDVSDEAKETAVK